MDLRFLAELTQTPGPYATVYLDASHDTADAARALALRWADRRAELAGQGAGQPTLDAILTALDAAVADGPAAVGRAGRVLVAAGGRVLLDRMTPEPPASPTAVWGPAPDLLPMLLDQPEPLTALVVRVDRTGGEILLATPSSALERVDDVVGSTENIHKARGGGPNHYSMQRRVEETWRDNVSELAAHVDAEVTRTGARVLVLAGDAPSRSLLRDALGERATAIAVDVDHGGAGDARSTGELTSAVDAAVRDVVTAQRHAVLDRLDQERGRPDGLAAVGLEPVLAALRAGQVDTLLLDGGVARDAQLWVADAPTQLASDPDQLRALGSEPTGRMPVDAALLRAAAASGAAFEPLGGGRTGLVGKPVDEGVAALLRYPLVTGRG